jgi:GNAT superfamily N-acetyltransferase
MTDTAVRARPVSAAEVEPWRQMYRLEMSCQIIHESIHWRPGWTLEYALVVGETVVGYGSVAVQGPWQGKPTVYEFYVVPPKRMLVFELFQTLLRESGAVTIEVQSNDSLITVMLHTFAREIVTESILFRDHERTTLAPPGASFRLAGETDFSDLSPGDLRWHGVVEVDGRPAGKGGILFHYNPPYGDIYMEVAEPFRRRGLGAFLVQELKRICYEGGRVPGARCNPGNVGSRLTLQRAGFVPCGHLLSGSVGEPLAQTGG